MNDKEQIIKTLGKATSAMWVMKLLDFINGHLQAQTSMPYVLVMRGINTFLLLVNNIPSIKPRAWNL